MKTLTRVLPVLLIVGLFASCGMSPEEKEEFANLKELKDSLDLTKEPRHISDVEKDFAAFANSRNLLVNPSAFGTSVYTPGPTDIGANTSLVVDGSTMKFYMVGYDQLGQYARSNEFNLRTMTANDTVGIEINLDTMYYSGNWYDLIVTDTVSDHDAGTMVHAGPFTHSQKSISIVQKFDGKVSYPQANSPITGNVPAFIGVNDARSVKGKQGSGSYAKLDFFDDTRKVRIHHKESGGNHYLVISSNWSTVPDQKTWCLYDFKHYCWGLNFNHCKYGCK